MALLSITSCAEKECYKVVKFTTACRVKAAVFLDRDGVLNIPEFRNGRSYAPLFASDFRLYPETKVALERLKQIGFSLVVVTNQPDIACGKLKETELIKMHDILNRELPLDVVKVCTHGKNDGCSCRKPKAGMLVEAAEELGIDLCASFMVGDRKSDMLVGETVGARTVFIDHGYTNDILPEKYDFACSSIKDAAIWISCQFHIRLNDN